MPWALGFDGASDDVNCGADSSIDDIFFETGGGRIDAWITPYSDGENDNGVIAFKSNWFFRVQSESSGKVELEFWHFRASNRMRFRTTNAVVPIDTLSLVSATYDANSPGTVGKLYLNNVEQTVTTVTTGSGAAESDVGEDLIFGNNAALSRCFDGLIHEIDIGVEQWLIDEGTGTTTAAEVESPANDGSITGAVWVNTTVPRGAARLVQRGPFGAFH